MGSIGSRSGNARRRSQTPPAITVRLLSPVAGSIWAAIITKQSSNLISGVLQRAKAVYDHLRTLWNDFCLWFKERQ